MAIYQTKLVAKREIASGTVDFVLEKPPGLTYRAGQYFDLILPKATPDAAKRDYQHSFSFRTAPYEAEIAAAMRMRKDSVYKRALDALPIGAPVTIDAAWGDYVLRHKADQPCVFLIGGIGVTPVRSMIGQATHDHTDHHLTLLFGNRNVAAAPFVDDFRAWAKANPNFTFVPAFDEPSGHAGDEHGFIDAAMLRRHVPDLDVPRFYLSGPPAMVRAMRELLTGEGVDEDNIKTEEFDGY